MTILRAKDLRTLCALAMFVCAYAAPDAQAQFGGLKVPKLSVPETPTVPEPAPPAAPTLTDDEAAGQAATDCVQAGKEDEAAGIALLFGGGKSEEGAESSDISKYLVGLCVPPGLAEQYALNEYLLAKGAMHSFYAERSLEEFVAYAESSGVELGVKFEALQKDSALTAILSGSNNMDKAAFFFNQNQTLARNVALLVPVLAQLQTDKLTTARGIAARARAHALNSSYFLSRGVYVSQQMTTAIAANAKEKAGGLRRLGGGNPLDAASAVADETGAQVEELRGFVEFVKKNGKAVAGTLTGMINVVKTLDPEAAEIPKLAKEDVAADEKRFNEAWDFQPEYADEATYGPANTPVEG